MKSLEERVAQLERRNRTSRRVAMAGWCAVAVVLFVAAGGDESPGELELRRLIVRESIEIRGQDNGARISLMLDGEPKSPVLRVHDEKGIARVVLGCAAGEDDAVFLNLTRANRQLGAEIFLRGAHEARSVVYGVEPRIGCGMAISQDGAPVLAVGDDKSHWRRMPNRAEEMQGALRLR